MLESHGRTEGISLRALLPDAEFFGARDIWVTSCSSDSRSCRAGDLFAALVGVSDDGHDHASEAIERGATAVLGERYLPIDGRPMCVVPDARAALGRICQALAGEPSRALKVIGITGGSGKTTTSCLIASILKHAGHQVGLIGKLGNSDSLEIESSTEETPPATVLADWLSRMVAAGCTHAVLEVSSRALVQSRVAGIEFDVACVTNVRRAHLDYHGSPANYRAAKGRIFDHLAQDGLAVINADDLAATEYLARLDCPVLTIGTKEIGEITGRLVERSASEQTFLISAGSDTAAVRTRMIGDDHLYNCLIATAVGLAYGIDLATIIRGLEAIDFVPGRLERIECGQPFAVFVDHARTPESLSTSLDTLREVTPGRLIAVFGAEGDHDRSQRPNLGRVAEALADHVILTADNPRREAPEAIAADILAGCEQPNQVETIVDRARAIHRALGLAQPGDTVVIAGKGHEMRQIVGVKEYEFDDREVARQALYGESQVRRVTPDDFFSRSSLN